MYIVSCIGTVNANLAKYLSKLLYSLSINHFTASDSFKFCSDIQDFCINNNSLMASFDVTSLFTNVPVNYTIDVILNYIYKENKIQTKIVRNDLKKLLIKGVTSHFIFNGVLYEQIDGCAMGSALSVSFANIFMCHLEDKLVKICPKLQYYRRYVDDIFVVITYDYLNNFLNIINSFHPAIKFTVETELAGQFSFLDVKINRLVSSGLSTNIVTSVYRKPTFTGLFINWNSWCPKKYKISIIKGLHERARRLCTTEESFNYK